MNKLLAILLTGLLLTQCTEEIETSECSTPATIRDLTGLDGCGFVFELADGKRLEPVRPFLFCGTPPLPKEITEDPLYNYQFVDGKKVFINYEMLTDRTSICMVGDVVKITCITDAPSSGNE